MNFLIPMLAQSDGWSENQVSNLIVGTFLFIFLSVIAIGCTFLFSAYCYHVYTDILPRWWKAVKSWLSFDIVFGDYDYNYRNHSRYHPVNATPIVHQVSTVPCDVHDWLLNKTTKHNWHMIGGKPAGAYNTIDDVLRMFVEKPGHSETLPGVIQDWKEKGAVRIYTSWNHYRCRNCTATQQSEFYTMPTKEDGRPLYVVGLSLKDTTRLPTPPPITTTTTSSRREIAVETMRWHCS